MPHANIHNTHIHTHVYISMFIYIHTNMYICLYIYVYIYIHASQIPDRLVVVISLHYSKPSRTSSPNLPTSLTQNTFLILTSLTQTSFLIQNMRFFFIFTPNKNLANMNGDFLPITYKLDRIIRNL